MKKIRNIKVENMESGRGNKTPNQFIITTNDGEYFQSYRTIIVFVDTSGNTFLDKNSWDYSTTTGKYRNQFLNEGIKETRQKIKEGIYKLVDLN